jgi:hypothetical protein
MPGPNVYMLSNSGQAGLVPLETVQWHPLRTRPRAGAAQSDPYPVFLPTNSRPPISPVATPHDERPPLGKIAAALLRAAGSTIVLVAIYYLLPLDHSARWVAITMLVIVLVLLIALITFQVRSILAAPFPGLRALEALATSIPLFLLLFAAAYVVVATISGGSFQTLPVSSRSRGAPRR